MTVLTYLLSQYEYKITLNMVFGVMDLDLPYSKQMYEKLIFNCRVYLKV